MGKGGTGKSAVTAALGMAAARSGAQTLVIELAARAVIPELLGAAPAHDEPREILPGLSAFSINPEDEAERHLRERLSIGPLINRITKSGSLGDFARAAPGIAELVSLDRIWSLATEGSWTQTIVDLPSTGHALALLGAPAEAVEVAEGGPLGDRAAPLNAGLRDPEQTAVTVVTLPTDLAVSEAGEAVHALRELGMPEPDLILNRMHPRLFAPDERPALTSIAGGTGPEAAAAAAGLRMIARREHDEELRDQLAADTGIARFRELPALVGEVDGDGLWTLAAAALGGPA